jgi:sporulation protein YlmC with PRC-barrel domain
MTADNIRLRNEFINTQVITRNTGKKLGVVKEILVDIDSSQVVALGLRDNILSLSGMPQYMYLDRISQTGDVILVEDEEAIEAIDIDIYSRLINSEVITETGEPLGRVRDFQFDLKTGKVSSIIIASLGLPQIPDQVISTYELSMEEVVSSGPNRLIVFEGAEERLTQLTVGVLERLGIGRPPWEKEEEESYYPPAVRPENQLGTGIPVRTPIQVRQPQPVEERWDEDVWEQPRSAPPRRQMESIRYEEEYEAELEADNWGETRREEKRSAPPEREYDYDYEYDEVESDVWDDAMGAEPYNPPPINIPEKRKEKMPEYNED